MFYKHQLNSSLAGKEYSEFIGEDLNTISNGSRLLSYYHLTLPQADYIIDAVLTFFEG